MPIGRIFNRFAAQTELLRDYGVTNGAANRDLTQRQWMNPDRTVPDEDKLVPQAFWDGNPLNPLGISYAYNRGPIANGYAEAFVDPQGSTGDVAAAKIQADYLSAQERAYRLRHLTPIRACMHASGRRSGHGVPESGVFGRVEEYVISLIVDGAIGFESP
jgi:hypothetical protein